jgi:hypothetical protein
MTALELAEHQSGAADHVEREPGAVPSLMEPPGEAGDHLSAGVWLGTRTRRNFPTRSVASAASGVPSASW